MQNSTAPLAVAVGRALPTSREKRAGPQPGSRQKKRKGRKANPGARKGAALGKPPAAPLSPLYMDEKDPLTGCPRWCKTPEQQRQWLISQHNHTSREEFLAMRDSWPGSCIIRASPAAPPVVVPGTPVSALAPPFIPQHLVPDVRQNVAVPMDAAPVAEGPAPAGLNPEAPLFVMPPGSGLPPPPAQGGLVPPPLVPFPHHLPPPGCWSPLGVYPQWPGYRPPTFYSPEDMEAWMAGKLAQSRNYQVLWTPGLNVPPARAADTKRKLKNKRRRERRKRRAPAVAAGGVPP